MRSAILGLLLAAATIVILFVIPQGTDGPGLSGSPDAGRSEREDLPPRLFPMFPDSGKKLQDAIAGGSVSISKHPTEKDAVHGSTVSWQVEVKNIGRGQLSDLTLDERFDSQKIAVENADGGTVGKNFVTWSIPELESGDTWTARVSAKILETDTPSSLYATAYVHGASIEHMSSASRMATNKIVIVPLPATGTDYQAFIGRIVAVISAVLTATAVTAVFAAGRMR